MKTKPIIIEDTIIQSGAGTELQSANDDLDWLMENPPSLPDVAPPIKKQEEELMTQKYEVLQHNMQVFVFIFFYLFIYLFIYSFIYERLPREASSILMNCYQRGFCLPYETSIKELLNLQMISKEGLTGKSNSEPFNPKFNTLTTGPPVQCLIDSFN